ncbi:MAG: hypothetical protein UT30_C0010G0028 [Candidatus Uhrbacteria bacterium GW2011_GWF2_39_13]|uniref:Uncharacterized protein n=1 Tax=Candidatus Uhrbacteria bacterium GW2011_GWF2_39_13 TaxID=1618995 RepID=A0A0G0MJQ3_9BACT|nr:MAG: hypothetical protein UT30_C0010G0028 [Candidatus Uhrbacteria bacterium GW2011_GWF2_39_13]HAU65808.1 hypothetical protein [Candidatus Uhrbacteria bacterium]
MMITSQGRTYQANSEELFRVFMQNETVVVEKGSGVSLVFETDALFTKLSEEQVGIGVDPNILRIKAKTPAITGELFIESVELTTKVGDHLSPTSMNGWIIITLLKE